MAFPVKGKEPGAFVLTSRKDEQKYVMSEKMMTKIQEWLTEEEFDALFTAEWTVLNEEERRLADEIKYRLGRLSWFT